MIDLSQKSGLPLFLDDSMRLVFGAGIAPVAPEARTIGQARNVLWNMTASGPEELYFMYRDVHRTEDKEIFDRHKVKYDITVLVPGDIGGEYIKTVGHYHPDVPGTTTAYPEVYEVIHGKAHFLLQKSDESGLVAKDVVIIEAVAGQKALIPPGYGHITINPGPLPLVITNLVEQNFHSVYGAMATAHGGAFYEVLEEDNMPVWVENEHYRDVAEPRLVEPKEFKDFGIIDGTPLYTAFLMAPERSDYLVHPHLYESQMKAALA
jgi:glucose-6-phosphate isomerase, archaeal